MDPEPILKRLLSLGPSEPLLLPGDLGQVSFESLLNAAGRHGLIGLLAERLPPNGDPQSRAARVQVERRLAVQRIRTEIARKTLAEALRALAKAGIRTAPLKGPCLAERLYRDPSSRPSGDADLLVASADLEPAVAAMEATGYHLDRGPLEKWQRRHHHHLSVHRQRCAAVELHFRAFTGFGITVASEPLLERSRQERIESLGSVWILSPEDEFLYLCLHAAGHLFQRLGWLYDLVLFVERYRTELDWSRVVDTTRTFPALEAIGLTLQHLRTLGVAVPDWPLPSPRKARAAETIRHAIAAPETPRRVVTIGTLAFHLLLSDRVCMGLRLVFHQLSWSATRRIHRWVHRRTLSA